jgi:hypothetical protein
MTCRRPSSPARATPRAGWENWRALLAVGVDQVTLLEDARAEYGPMSLHPED